ncbi:MAG: hypothetical protein V1712_03455 [Patescibacteria group bacterium]
MERLLSKLRWNHYVMALVVFIVVDFLLSLFFNPPFEPIYQIGFWQNIAFQYAIVAGIGISYYHAKCKSIDRQIFGFGMLGVLAIMFVSFFLATMGNAITMPSTDTLMDRANIIIFTEALAFFYIVWLINMWHYWTTNRLQT